ncbi:MAG: hypothetical protein KBC81_03465 [Candidatus Pacebacteria bacterium]|nr:hypothetical protein [Candidatus Paceibacterota bacterium]
MEKEITKDIIVFYHGLCLDGFTSAWAAWKKFGDTAEYIPLIWTSLKPDQIPQIENKEVYFLDFTPRKEEVERIIRDNKVVQIIDHHISVEETLKTVPNAIYDVSHSGAVLSWNFFHPNKAVPQLSLYVEDGDLWKWSIPKSAEVLNVIDLKREFDFSVWDSLYKDLEDEKTRISYEEKGELIKQYRDKVIDIIIKEQAQVVDFEGHEIYAINAPRYFKSEIGNVLSHRKPPFAIVWSQTPDDVSVSLRSIKDFDLVPMATKYNGGGHEHAANFRLPLGSPLPWKIIKEDEK